jgi:hypothetical protein
MMKKFRGICRFALKPAESLLNLKRVVNFQKIFEDHQNKEEFVNIYFEIKNRKLKLFWEKIILFFILDIKHFEEMN